jgi:quinol monooxygenase YgiN
MTEHSVVVVATITAKPGREADVQAALTETVPKVHQEDGCQLYSLHRSTTDPAVFVMVEKWASGAALAAHSKAPALAEMGGKLAGAVSGPPAVTVLRALPAGDGTLGAV